MAPRTPDRFPGSRYETELLMDTEEYGDDPDVAGALRYVNGVGFRAKDDSGVFNLRSGSGLTEAQHRILRQLIHFIEDGPAEGFASGAYKETTPTSPFPTSEIWWESASKLKKIVELTTTWSGVLVSTEQWEMYDTDGATVLATVTDTYTYSGVFESSKTRTIAIS